MKAGQRTSPMPRSAPIVTIITPSMIDHQTDRASSVCREIAHTAASLDIGVTDRFAAADATASAEQRS